MPVRLPWRVRTRGIDIIVPATDQWEAWDAIADRPINEFGVLVTAECNESGDPIAIRTSVLMFRWDREGDARTCIRRAMMTGLPDTTDHDRAAGRKEG